MNAEIITIGDELVTGFRVDTNCAFICRQLTSAGYIINFTTSVGDSIESMEEAFRLAMRRASLVVTTGGLGPTDDDITKKAIVKTFKRNLIFHEDILSEIKERYARRGIEMPAINQNQALLPQGARFFPNKTGSAVGICIAEQGKIFVALPGVPREMEQIVQDELIPYLLSLKTTQNISSTTLKTTGIVESRLAELIAPGLKLEQGVKLAYLPGYSGVNLRIIARADTPEEAQAKCNALATEIAKKCDKYIFGRDDDTLEGIVGQLLLDNDKTLSVAESCTAGQLGMTITSVSGASRYFVGGGIVYANEAKIERLGVDPEIIEKDGAVSEECALAMAEGARQAYGSSYALSVTGIAGPDGGTEDKPVGTTWIGLASAHSSIAKKYNFGTERNSNRIRASYAALELLRREILDIK
ncbi:MAG: competence/damage-inducible protein A [bacterium]|nr:competence/damage-inducible protein A [bacterium]